LTSIARGRGLALASLQRWVAAERPERLRPVRVGPTPEATSARGAAGVLITPGGFRIEGLEVEQLAALLRSLA
jgi:hypothetical protein